MARNARGESIARFAHMDQKTGFGSGPYLMQLGLGDANTVDGVEISWPVSRCRKTYSAKINELNTFDEASCGL